VPIDLDLQKRLWEGFFETWYGVPQLGGFMVWEWPPGVGGPENRNYTPEAKPAEEVVRRWLARDPWRVEGAPARVPASKPSTQAAEASGPVGE
jgi:hypothetical protein